MRPAVALLLAAAVAVALIGAGCGGSSSSTSSPGGSAAATASTSTASSTTHLAKTKFVLHAGLAFAAFHRYIYKPFKAGAFRGGLFHHKLATLKAGVAAGFAYHEVKLALQDARSSKLLSKVLSPLLALQTKLGALAAGLKHGQVDPAAITSANSAAGQASQAGAQAGQPVTDQPVPSF